MGNNFVHTVLGNMRKRSVRVAGHPTSVSLEDEFWDALNEIARQRQTSMTRLIGEIDAKRAGTGLSSAIRIYVLKCVRTAANG